MGDDEQIDVQFEVTREDGTPVDPDELRRIIDAYNRRMAAEGKDGIAWIAGEDN